MSNYRFKKLGMVGGINITCTLLDTSYSKSFWKTKDQKKILEGGRQKERKPYYIYIRIRTITDFLSETMLNLEEMESYLNSTVNRIYIYIYISAWKF